MVIASIRTDTFAASSIPLKVVKRVERESDKQSQQQQYPQHELPFEEEEDRREGEDAPMLHALDITA